MGNRSTPRSWQPTPHPGPAQAPSGKRLRSGRERASPSVTVRQRDAQSHYPPHWWRRGSRCWKQKSQNVIATRPCTLLQGQGQGQRVVGHQGGKRFLQRIRSSSSSSSSPPPPASSAHTQQEGCAPNTQHRTQDYGQAPCEQEQLGAESRRRKGKLVLLTQTSVVREALHSAGSGGLSTSERQGEPAGGGRGDACRLEPLPADS